MMSFNFNLTVSDVYPSAKTLLDNIYFQEYGIYPYDDSSELKMDDLVNLHKFYIQAKSEPSLGDSIMWINYYIQGCLEEDSLSHGESIRLIENNADLDKLSKVWEAISLLHNHGANRYYCEVTEIEKVTSVDEIDALSEF